MVPAGQLPQFPEVAALIYANSKGVTLLKDIRATLSADVLDNNEILKLKARKIRNRFDWPVGLLAVVV